MNDVKQEVKATSLKTKMSAVLLVIFLGLFGWLYTWKKSASKFLVSFFTIFGIYLIYTLSEWFILLWLLPVAGFAMWLWAIIDMAIKPDSFFTNYPNG